MGADIVIAVDLNADIMRRHMRLQEPRDSELRIQSREVSLSELQLETEPPADEAPPLQHPLTEPAGWSGKWRRSVSSVKTLSASVMRRGQKSEGDAEGDEPPRIPSLTNVLLASINIMQMRITRSRMAGDPAEVLIAPRVSHIGQMDFHQGRESIDEGYTAAQLAMPALRGWGL
jgi:NTE family protein